jgi:RluA family pseudouridine synthase
VKWLVPAPQKLVSFLQGQLGDYSGKFLRRLLEANLCRINGKVERFGSRVVNGGDAVELAPSWKSLLTPKLSSLEILYEDANLKIINKPSGWVCDPKTALKAFGPGQYLVHRLDKDTTGLLIIAKGAAARDQLMEMFERREIAKSYLAIVDGIPKDPSGVRQSLFVKKGSYEGQTIWGSGQKGLTAITHWKRIAVGKNASLILCEPVTGRTHQIRVHLAEMGHPILVDRQYAKFFRSKIFAQRALLHAHRLQFSFQGKAIDLTAPLFLDMRDVLRDVAMDMRHLRELLGKEEENPCGDQSHDHKDTKEVGKSTHFLHRSSK